MKLFKIVRFYLAITLAFPFVGLYLVGAAVFSGQWKLIPVKLQLIYLSLYQKFLDERIVGAKKELSRQRVKSLLHTKGYN